MDRIAALGLFVFLVGLLNPIANADAGETHRPSLSVTDAWARPNLPNRPTAAYMTLSNAGTNSAIVESASSTSFGKVELHRAMKNDGVMMMMPVETIEVPAAGTAVLEPGGLHLMLFDAVEAFKIGDTFSLTLQFRNGKSMDVEVVVARKAGHGASMDHSGHGNHGAGASSGAGHSGHSAGQHSTKNE